MVGNHSGINLWHKNQRQVLGALRSSAALLKNLDKEMVNTHCPVMGAKNLVVKVNESTY
jgi:hypothetical protein